MADLRRIIGSALAAAATGNPFAWQENEVDTMWKRAQMEMGMENLRMQKEMHDLERKKFDIAIKQAEREGQGFFERLGLIPSSQPQGMPDATGEVPAATQPSMEDIVRAIFTKGTAADVKGIGIPLLTAATKDTKPVAVGGQGVYTPGKGFEKAPWEKTEGKAPVVRTFTEGDKTIDKQWNPDTKTWDAVSSGPRYKPEGGPSIASQRHVSTGLRKEFNSLGPVKEYREIENKFNVMDKAYEESKKSGNFVAIDQALITLYNKMTDPNSVVRESEYVRTPQDMAAMNRVKAAVARVAKGGRLEPDTRQALMTMATKFREVYSGKFSDLAQEWREYAIGYGVDPNLVINEKIVTKVKESGKPQTVNYKVGDLYEGRKVLGINRQTRQLNIEGLGVVSY